MHFSVTQKNNLRAKFSTSNIIDECHQPDTITYHYKPEKVKPLGIIVIRKATKMGKLEKTEDNL